MVSQARPWEKLSIPAKGPWTRGLTCLSHGSQGSSDSAIHSGSQAWAVLALALSIALQVKNIFSVVMVIGHSHVQGYGPGLFLSAGEDVLFGHGHWS